MNFDIQLFLSAVGLAFAFEALPWILFPEKMRSFMMQFALSPTSQLRIVGLVALFSGLAIVWAAKYIT